MIETVSIPPIQPELMTDQIASSLNRLEEYCLYERRLGRNNTKTIVSMARHMYLRYGSIEPTKRMAITIEEDLVARGRAPETIKQRLYILELIAGSVGVDLKIRKPRKVHRRVRFLTREEAKRLVAGACNVRDCAIISVLLYTGMRSRELIGLDVEDIDLDNRTIYIHDPEIGGKNRFERDAVIPKQLMKPLAEWLKARPEADTRALFITEDGRRLIRERLYNILKDSGKRARISQNVSPHLCRHTLATWMVDADLNIFIVQRQLGHKDIKSTMVYVHVDNHMVRRAMDAKFEY